MSGNYTDEKIKKIINQYKRKRERENDKYHNELKLDAEWKKMNTEHSKDYYNKNVDDIKQKYQNNKEFIKCRNLYYYYKRDNRENIFISKHPEKCKVLDDNCFVYKEVENKNNVLEMFED
tara:strand:+ start:587 stop:946 length:360 start_codon:yes stop_codon:yes gene_type:complete